MGAPRSHPGSHAWLRVLVLLLALLAAGAPSGPFAPPAAASGVAGFAAGEHDVLDSALRPAPCVHRPAAPPRPASLPAPASATATRRPLLLPPTAPAGAVRCLRTVVLRC
ncbi:hypothetical protein [Streptomyces sp. NPDC048481]|uniref:hypothetical protein n=1 Tax=Streptomyces sp. NPDC048481 TaxID=3365557 RepID=UPI00371E9AF4